MVLIDQRKNKEQRTGVRRAMFRAQIKHYANGEDTYTMLVDKSKSLMIDAFSYRVLIVLTNSIAGSVNKHLGKFPKDANISTTNAAGIHVYHPDVPLSMIVLPFEPSIDLLTHETYHCVNRLMNWIGAEHENEVVAYLVGYIASEIAEFAYKVGTPKVPKIPKRVIKQLQSQKIKNKLDNGQRVIVQ